MAATTGTNPAGAVRADAGRLARAMEHASRCRALPRHPHLLPLLGVRVDRGRPVLVWPAVPGPSLAGAIF